MIYKLLGFEEGFEKQPYYCTEGYPTAGKGTKLGPKGAPLKYYQFVFTEKIADAFLEEELRNVRDKLIKHRWYVELNEDRQTIIKSMAYQMGIGGLFKFKKMIAALESGDWNEAAHQALDSRWAKQTPARAERHAAVIANGNLMEVYEGLI